MVGNSARLRVMHLVLYLVLNLAMLMEMMWVGLMVTDVVQYLEAETVHLKENGLVVQMGERMEQYLVLH